MQLGAFPIDSAAMNSFKKLYEAGRGFVLLLLPTVVLFRFCINIFFLKGTEDNINVIKDLVMAAMLFGSFMFLINGITQIPTYYGDLLKDYATYELQVETTDVIGKYISFIGWMMVGCYWFCYLLYFAVLGLSCAFGAYIIIAGTLFQSIWILKATFWCLVLLASWPIGWYTINVLCNVLIKEETTLTSWFIVGFLSLFKCLIPTFAIFKIWNSAPANAAKSAASMALTGSQKAFTFTKSAGTGSARAVFGKQAVDKFAKNARTMTRATGAVAKAAASTTTDSVRTKFASGVKSAAQFAHGNLPKNVQDSIRSSASKIRTVTTPEINKQGRAIPLSSPLATSIKQISPRIHAKAVEDIITAESKERSAANFQSKKSEAPRKMNSNKASSQVSRKPLNSKPEKTV